MSEITNHSLSGVAETLLIPLYIRAIESQRPDALLKDEKAVAFVTQMDAAFSRIKQIKMDEEDKAELVFDAFSPFLVRANNLRLKLSRTKMGARYHWGLKRGKDLENWGDGICLLGEWFPFDRPEPRLARVQWVRHIPPLAKVMGIFHY